ncbi:MAG: competence/damage-inducible protein A [Firmicutes bacterium]|nr:competence/damage-inducible protein A [Bacillota bacterium]
MKTAILSVGTEILMGQIVNTNAVYLSQELNALGFDVMYHHTVGDNTARLKETMDLLFHDCDLIITTGGLGPTQDDLTKETVCSYMEDELIFDEVQMKELEEAFKRYRSPMTENNIKQAYLPSRAVKFSNPHGTAPGFALENKGKYVICLPGPPREMKEMFSLHARPYLEEKADAKIVYKLIRTMGIGESQLETQLLDLIDGQTDPTLATYAKEGESYVRVASKRETKEEATAAVEDMIEKVRDRIGEFIYSEDNEDLWTVTGRLLLEKGLTLSAAESCTGGLFAKTMTDIPGISEVFDRSLVTYSNKAKMEELGVKAETLEKYGAVSEETAREMAEGLERVSGSDICISVTGVAGPGGGTEEKPVGLSYIGFRYKGETKCKEVRTRDVGRAFNRNRTMLNMINMIYREIK